jgi:ADP-ribosylglycohydrolase
MTNLGEVTHYIQTGNQIFKPDDDLVMPLIMMQAMRRKNSPEGVTAEAIGETWLNLLSEERGSIWRGGYGVSSEHTAYLNMLSGISAPMSGSAAMNGKIISEQIGGQIFSDIWGLVLPNAPQAAADLSEKAASVSHDGEGINGARFVAALVSAAFSEKDPSKLMEIGLGVLPQESEYVRVMKDMIQFHKAHSGDWHAARRHIDENWGYNRYPGIVPIIPNAAIIGISLLYGGGDFDRTIQIANISGWDTDCNVGNVGAILGVAVGMEGISDYWREPMNDYIVSASVQGARNIIDLPATADFLVACGRRFAGKVVQEQSLPKYHFDYPGSTHGLMYEKRRCRVIQLIQTDEKAFCGRGSLKIALDRLNRKGEALIYFRTHIWEHELTSNHYEASFSPLVYPGQKISVQVYMPEDLPDFVHVALFIRDRSKGFHFQPPGKKLVPGQWNEISLEIPYHEDICISDVGIDIRSMMEDPWSGVLYLDALDWGGAPDYFTNLRQLENNGKTVTGWTTYRGYWRIDDGYCGSGVDYSESYTGDVDWKNYSVMVEMQPVLGDQHLLNLRVQDGRHCYALGFVGPGQAGVFKKVAGSYQQVSAAPFDWEMGKSYLLSGQAYGNKFSLLVDGEEILTWKDESAPYLQGQIGLCSGPGSHTRYKTLRIKPA